MPLPDWLVVIILGIIEGITEFIPVSSTGHLLIAEHFLQYKASDLFNIVIQAGAVLAVLPLFKDRLAMLARWRTPESQSALAKIGAAFLITCIGGYVLDKKNFTLPDEVNPIAWALIIGGLLFITVEMFVRGRKRTNEITWQIALVVGGAQLLAAVFPGASRSGATILFALLMGAARPAATEFSFLVGIPTILAASTLKLFKAFSHPHVDGPQESWALLFLGTVIAAIVSFIAVKWLLQYVQHHTFVGFGWYRVIFGAMLLILLALRII